MDYFARKVYHLHHLKKLKCHRIVKNRGNNPMCKKSIFVGAICLNVLFHISYIATGYDPIAIAEGRSLKEVFKRVNPSVVVILTKEGGYSKSIPNLPIVRSGLGSGIAVSKDGHIMTAAHVVQAADEVYVRFLDGRQVPARVVSAAQQADVAMVKLEDLPDNLPVAEFGDSDLAEICHLYIAIVNNSH